MKLRDILILAVLAGAVATFVHGYYFGLVNHVEHLPRIMRIMDPGYILNDFTTNATSGYEPRFYYSHLMALLGKAVSLPVAFLVLTFLANVGTALVTAFVGRRLFRSDASAIAGTALVMSLNATNLGEAGALFNPGLLPAALITPVALLALWCGVENRPLVCALLAAVATFIHPLLGLELGFIGLGTALLAVLLGVAPERAPKPSLRGLGMVVLPGIGLVLFAAIVWLRPEQRIFSDRQFVGLYGWFRAPHHIIPGTFPLRDWVSFVVLLALGAASWQWWRRDTGTDRGQAWRLALPVGFTLLLLFCGWFFVEVVPSRMVAAVQLYRLTIVVKWLGLMLLGNAAVRLRLPRGRRRLRPAVMLAALGCLVLLLWLGRGSMLTEATALVALAAAGASLFIRRTLLRYAASLGVAAGTLVLSFTGPGPYRPDKPVFTIDAAHDLADPVAAFARLNTQPGAVFVTPPLAGRFRITARRAIIVDFKNFVFSDQAMAEWYRRMVDCYGEARGRGFYAAYELEGRYRGISEQRLLSLAQRYAASYAVLYRETPCGFPLLYQDQNYKLVEIPEPAAE